MPKIFKYIKNMERCSASLIIREIHIKNHNEVSLLHPLGWLESKGQIVSIDKDVEEFEPSYFAGRMAKWYSQFGRKPA